MDNLHINCRNTTLTPAIEQYIEKKLEFINKFEKYIEQVNIEISDNQAESLPIKYEITIAIKNGMIRVEERGSDLYALIDLGHDRVKVKLEKYKDRLTDHSHEKLAEESALPVEDIEDEVSEPLDSEIAYKPRITKRKSYSDNRPLHPEEAITQMEMLGHTSFLFKNIETNKYAMVYRRNDGFYGLIEPENP